MTECGSLTGTAFRRTEGDAWLPPLTSEDWRRLSGSCPELEGEARSLSDAPDPCSTEGLRVCVEFQSDLCLSHILAQQRRVCGELGSTGISCHVKFCLGGWSIWRLQAQQPLWVPHQHAGACLARADTMASAL